MANSTAGSLAYFISKFPLCGLVCLLWVVASPTLACKSSEDSKQPSGTYRLNTDRSGFREGNFTESELKRVREQALTFDKGTFRWDFVRAEGTWKLHDGVLELRPNQENPMIKLMLGKPDVPNPLTMRYDPVRDEVRFDAVAPERLHKPKGSLIEWVFTKQ